MRIADGTDIHPGDKVMLDEEQIESLGSRDALPENGMEGLVGDVDEENGLVTVNVDGEDLTLSPSAILGVEDVVRRD